MRCEPLSESKPRDAHCIWSPCLFFKGTIRLVCEESFLDHLPNEGNRDTVDNMGQSTSSRVEDVTSSRYLTPGELREYQELTFLNKKDICHIHKVFIKILPTGTNFRNAKLTAEQICSLPGLRVNPYRDRICKIFSDEEGFFSFEHFLEMASVFSKQASFNVKVWYAFRIFDLNDCGFIDKDDIHALIQRLTNRDDTPVEVLDYAVQQIMKEADLNNDNLISLVEFEHGINKAPDFLQSFSIQF